MPLCLEPAPPAQRRRDEFVAGGAAPVSRWRGPSLGDFVATHYPRLLNTLRAHLGCADLAADSLHDAWLRLADGDADPGVAVANPGAYVFRMACNIAIDRLRAERPLRGACHDIDLEDVEDTAPGPQRIAQARSSMRDLLRLIDTLPRQQREIFIDVRIEGMLQSEAAARYGVSGRIVRRHLRDACRHVESQAARLQA
ncbi:RNA polymerase sigma factor [Achromobacter sp. UMC71]|uniref:RNA polymerase sigma factor n=1 Tax=Achromobacter sp. UMC71 TaxID=1862320 RepID=UPI0016032C44|nr:sigma-70 family RNA polymerase sigma factor [Achromobacter sp. UMC71]MBB1627361.1 hypothetical protein [Achromobacter sp. UMC71]